MSWDSGTFHRLYSWNADAAAGFDILADRFDADTNDIVGGLNNVLTRDGQNQPLSNLPMGGFRHTGVAPATANDHYARYDQVVKTTGDGTVNGNLTVTGNTTLNGTTTSQGLLTANSGANITGSLGVAGPINASSLTTTGDVYAGGGLGAAGALSVAGAASLSQGLDITGVYPGGGGYSLIVNGQTYTGNLIGVGSANISGPLISGSYGQFNQGLYVTGAYPGDSGGRTLYVNGGAFIGNGLTLCDPGGHVVLSTDLGVPHFYTIPGQGDVAIFDGGTLNSRGPLIVDNTAQINGAMGVAGPFTVSGNAGVTGDLTVGGTINGHPPLALTAIAARLDELPPGARVLYITP